MTMEPTIQTQLIDAEEPLTDVFRHYYCIRQAQGCDPVMKQLLPNYEMLLVFSFGANVPIWLGDKAGVVTQTAVVGPLHQVLRYELPAGADLMVIVFTLNGFHRLLGQPASEGRSEHEPADDMLLNQTYLEPLWANLTTIPTVEERIAYLNAYMRQHLTPADDDTRLMHEGVAYLNDPAIDPVKTFAQERHLSVRNIQSRIQNNLGFSAKELIRFLRFKKVVTQLIEQHPQPPDWNDVVLLNGYHDRSHLNKDFKQFTGMTPTEFMRQLADQTICLTRPGKHY